MSTSIYPPDHGKLPWATEARIERLHSGIRDAIEAIERGSTSAPVLEALKALIRGDEQSMLAQVPGGPTCHPGAFWEASSPTTGVSLAVCSICKQPAKT